MQTAVRILGTIAEEMLAHGRRDTSKECCGLLAGRDGVSTHTFPATNVALNPATNFEIAPKELFRLMREIRAGSLELLGIYHSHPMSENKPSPTDIERAYYPDVTYFIVSPCADASQPVRAFSIAGGRVSELKIQSIDD